MRGKGVQARYERVRMGITPAYAGKSFSPRRCRYKAEDHPRVCGEKGFYRPHFRLRQGSPPRMRGKAAPFLHTAQRARITPAYAGKSAQNQLVRERPQDHPRVCGEKTMMAEALQSIGGSPPRMRGKVEPLRNDYDYCRITPAYAGKRQRQRRYPQGGRDHPRVCGEKEIFLRYRPHS